MAEVKRIRVVGAGAMGRGIAQVAVASGMDVELTDVSDDAVAAGIEFVGAMLRRSAEKGQRTQEDAETAIARLGSVGSPTSPSSDVDLVIEAVVEQLEVKQTLLAELESALPGAILATNTSSLSVTGIGSVLKRPERFVGLHFFNPVPLMKLVEVVPGLRTSPEVVTSGVELVHRLGHTAVLARDTPGFLVNHLGRGLPTEALALLDQCIGEPADIDRIARDTVGLRMGPFELMDLTGLDVSHPVLETVFEGFHGEPRLRPSPSTGPRVSAGLLGRKSGEGFYRYEKGAARVAAEPQWPRNAAATPVYVHEHRELADLLAATGARVLPSYESGAVALVAPWGEPTYRTASRHGLDPARTVGVDPLSLAGERLTVVVPPTLEPAAGAAFLEVLAATGRSITVTADGPAPVAQRLVASIVNVATALAESGAATPTDIDLGAGLGLGYPRGPLELGDAYGPDRIVHILDGLLEYTGDPRYRASGWLRTRAELGLSLRTTGTRPRDLTEGAR